MLRAGAFHHKALSRLAHPARARHLPAADGAAVLAPRHCAQRGGLVGIAAEHMAVDAAGKLLAGDAVLVRLLRPLIVFHAAREIQPRADERGVICVTKCVMRGAARLDAHHLHRRFERPLRHRAVGLHIKNKLRVIPAADPVAVHRVQREIFLQHGNIVKAPGEEHAVLPAPGAKTRHRLGKRHALGAQPRVLDAGELTDLAVHLLKIFRSY